jgi:transcription factor SPN1
MSDIGSPADKPVDDGQEQEFEDEVAAADSDHNSDALSEVDENQFEDYDPETANIEDRPVDIDEDVAATLKVTKRKRTDGEAPKKPKEGRREKKRRDRDEDVAMDEGLDVEAGKKPRRRRAAAAAADEGRRSAAKAVIAEPENEEDLTPEERRKRAIDRAIDSSMKKSGSKRRRKDEEDLEDEMDEKLAMLKVQMDNACQADNAAREAGKPALHKLKLLPQVTGLLNRNNAQNVVLDPEVNFLQHVKFFLEPLNDGSLPAYNIQRDVFDSLTKLSVSKDALLSSGIGKVVLFYTRSKKPEPSIKRMAEQLLAEWSRPILKRTDDYRQRHVETAEFDYHAAKRTARQKVGSQFTLSERPAKSAERDRLLALAGGDNQARVASLPATYTIAPQSTFEGARGDAHRPLGAGGMEAFRRMTQKSKKKA